MADDIVTRLKDEAFLNRCGHGEKITTAELMEQAADELQRLRAEVERLSSFLHPIGVVINAYKGKKYDEEKIVEILRKAIRGEW